MEERTREVAVGPAFVPGDLIGIEMGSLRHRTGIEEVLAVFEMDDSEDEGRTPGDITLVVASSRRPFNVAIPRGTVTT